MHTDICGPFDVNSFRKEGYFITIIDDYSRYDYVYLLPEISQAMDALEIYQSYIMKKIHKITISSIVKKNIFN